MIAVFSLVLAPQLKETSALITQNIQAALPKAEKWLSKTLSEDIPIDKWLNTIEFNWAEIAKDAGSFLKEGVGSVLSTGIDAVFSVISGVVNFFIGLIFSIYVLMQKERLGDQAVRILKAVLPEQKVQSVCKIASMSFTTFSGFIRGQCLEAVILGVLFVIAMSIFGFPYALFISVVVAITALIPIFGAFIGCAIGAFIILLVSPVKALLFIVMFLIIQQIEGNFIYPYVVGNSIGLPSIWVLVSVTVGGGLMGVGGMLLFIPLCSVCYSLFRAWVNSRNELQAQQEKEPQIQPAEE